MVLGQKTAMLMVSLSEKLFDDVLVVSLVTPTEQARENA
jgi:hypothetical protein